MLQLVSVYILTCFDWQILKTKIILVKHLNFGMFFYSIGPAPAKDLWIPNPLTTQMEFYNKVLCELYEAVFDVNIAPLQFNNYVIEQRVS